MIEIRTSPTLQHYKERKWVTVGGEIIIVVEANTLAGADLSHRNLDWAYLPDADLRNVNFAHSALHGANLSRAALSDANFERASLAGIDLQGATLTNANFTQAWMPGARLQGADMRFANMQTAKLRFARYDETTQWPQGFDPQEQGAELPHQWRENRR